MFAEAVLDTADVVLLGDTDVGVELLNRGEWVLADLLDFLLNALPDVLLNLFGLIEGGKFVINQVVASDLNGVTGLSHLLDLLLGAVGDAWVRHRVAVVSVGVALNEEGSILNDIGASPLESLTHHQDVLSLDLDAGDTVTSFVEVCVVSSTTLRSAHTVVVVLAHVDHGQFPETGHVGSLKELALIGSTITIESAGEILLTLVFKSESQAGADWQLGTDNTVAAVVVLLSVVVMHGATFALAGASVLGHHLGNDAVCSVTSSQSLAMVSVSSDEAVFFAHSGLHAFSNSFLTVIQVAEAANLAFLVEHVRHDFHTAHLSHTGEVGHHFFLGESCFGWEELFVESVGAHDLRQFDSD